MEVRASILTLLAVVAFVASASAQEAPTIGENRLRALLAATTVPVAQEVRRLDWNGSKCPVVVSAIRVYVLGKEAGETRGLGFVMPWEQSFSYVDEDEFDGLGRFLTTLAPTFPKKVEGGWANLTLRTRDLLVVSTVVDSDRVSLSARGGSCYMSYKEGAQLGELVLKGVR